MNTPLGNGLFVLVLGLLVVFLGMFIIVVSVMACGKLLNKSEQNKPKQQVEVVPQPIQEVTQVEEIPEHVKAAIVAVISAYYFETKSNCDFVVKKIKRI